jgi:hypothetical protein
MTRYNMRLNDKGQCFNCLVKPLVYKTPTLHYFCVRCDREYNADGNFRPNWAWEDEYLPTGFGGKERKEQRARELSLRSKPKEEGHQE